MIIGVTGPIGSGKDEVCQVLKKRGFHIIDADKIGHQILGKGINRKKLGDEVFADKKKLRALNRIIHPKIKQEISKKIKTLSLAAINAALLKEIGLIKLCDEVWVVMAPRRERIRRLLGRYDRKKINAIMKNQMGERGYLQIADKTIWNKGNLDELRSRIKV
ncbi:dephospho-CoA kinase [candidate division WOR-1 bacterium RIFOXYA12_FULL_43_27]|uniref:Dephospho-CoA kinase n=1 Tax=candidate division WOR-1 bacterium RIFOXYC2_FULL_46_14 TaxID=1802587 RepID=A0A1F4U6F1_UNCSA|nr:MAG: dephospho-CoA kinase [candidate division WOR-1 bacterium RIFOXYA12_FULL_43_27]OGC20558.1 MAG: dephospho-CoA kinase [candidate division WOR-1 bacterium RIFOXYB2_FULL_46_45]OGC31705.1 MAG: dephospho-CoA kinase [candidate division WOR-1 bacterium RIFOXYA2_FULL_46_56]OGC40400.1 MAG: dephospho-CoA kinase [candidate division WOR-1 bacterium RIFOXYC2_FULL_46_14]